MIGLKRQITCRAPETTSGRGRAPWLCRERGSRGVLRIFSASDRSRAACRRRPPARGNQPRKNG
eukprot:3056714-Alexandrium_andersonii.AAC.1